MAKSPYARKEWLRKHSTSKEMRWLNNGIDAAVKGIGSGRSRYRLPEVHRKTGVEPHYPKVSCALQS